MRCLAALLFLPFVVSCGSSDASDAAGSGGAPATSLRQADGTCDPTGTWDFSITGGGIYPSCSTTQLYLNGVTFTKTPAGTLATSTDGFLTATNMATTTVTLAPDNCSIEIEASELVDPTMTEGEELDLTITLDLSVTPATGTYGFEAPADCGDQEFAIDSVRRPGT